MASSQFLDPKTLFLRTTPLLAATITLTQTLTTSLHLTPLNSPSTRHQTNPLLPAYISKISSLNTYHNLTLIPLTLVTALANLYIQPTTSATRWFKIGAGFTIARLVFEPFMAAAEEAIKTNHVARDANVALDEWLWYNKVRGLTLDLGAWVVFGVAVVKSLAS